MTSSFHVAPNSYIEKAIKEFVATSPANQLPDFNNEPIFEEPLVGFASGADPIFRYYKALIDDFHLTPAEAFARRFGSNSHELSVISWVLPIGRETRLGMRQETKLPTIRWNRTRWQGQDFITAVSNHLIALLAQQGYRAVAPELESFFDRKDLRDGRASNWSQRHMAYAAGLGTFSLSDGLITPRGVAMRCGSVVTDAPLSATLRTSPHHLANCLFYRDRSCRRCIERCPADAITENGHDKKRCHVFLEEQKVMLKELGRAQDYIGRYAGCGLCQTKVPCEGMIPPSIARPK